jgi:hypothetical protein
VRLRRRLEVAIAAIAGTIVILPMGGSAAAQGPDPELMPDLRGLQAQHLSVQEAGGVRDLRLSTTVANTGAGVLEIYPVAGGNCDGDGDPANDRTAFQRVFRDGDGNGFFTRPADTDSVSYQAGCMVFHPAHSHWHFEDFARYELRRTGSGEVVSSTTKVSFCLVDSGPFDPSLGGYDSARFYNDCSEDATEGLSIGWSDTYLATLPGQSIDIRGVPNGDYCLAVKGDPSDIVRESDESNNEAVMRIQLKDDSATPAGSNCDTVSTPPVAVLPASNQAAPKAAAPARCKKPRKGVKRKAKRKCRRRS